MVTLGQRRTQEWWLNMPAKKRLSRPLLSHTTVVFTVKSSRGKNWLNPFIATVTLPTSSKNLDILELKFAHRINIFIEYIEV